MSRAVFLADTRVFCPRCGTLMELRDGELWCPKGDMGLSRHASELVAAIVAHAPVKHHLPGNYGSDWFCPADGTKLQIDQEALACPRCQRSLPKELLFNLVEFHPHRA